MQFVLFAVTVTVCCVCYCLLLFAVYTVYADCFIKKLKQQIVDFLPIVLQIVLFKKTVYAVCTVCSYCYCLQLLFVVFVTVCYCLLLFAVYTVYADWFMQIVLFRN